MKRYLSVGGIERELNGLEGVGGIDVVIFATGIAKGVGVAIVAPNAVGTSRFPIVLPVQAVSSVRKKSKDSRLVFMVCVSAKAHG
jgi:hypothetical protein